MTDQPKIPPSDTANTVEGKMLTDAQLNGIRRYVMGFGPQDSRGQLKDELELVFRHITALQCLVTRLEGERDEARAKALEEAAKIALDEIEVEQVLRNKCAPADFADRATHGYAAETAGHIYRSIRSLTQGPGK
jgi:hypothetical protein